MSWLLLFLSVFTVLLSSATAFYDPGSFFGNFHKPYKHPHRHHGNRAEEDCDCRYFKARDRDLQHCMAEKESLRHEKESLRHEKARNTQRCSAEKDSVRNEKARELQRCRTEKDRLRAEKDQELRTQRDQLRAEKERLRAQKDQELRTQRDQLRAQKDQQLRTQKDQSRAEKEQLKSQLKESSANSWRLQKSLTEEQAKHGKASACQPQLQAERAAKRGLEGELKEEKRSRMRIWSQLQSERDSKAALKSDLRQERRTAGILKSELKQERTNLARLAQEFGKAETTAANVKPRGAQGCFWKASWTLLVVGATSVGFWFLKRLDFLRRELEQKQELLGCLERDLGKFTDEAAEGELTGELQQDADSSFAYLTCWEERGEERVRCVKVQCPSRVEPSDVTVDVLFNGCTVNIASTDEAHPETWTKRFQFRSTNCLLEFAEDQAKFEDGWLTLVFRPYASQSRVFRFPRPFSFGADGPAGTSAAGAAAEAGHCLPEYFNLTSYLGESSEEDEEFGQRVLETPSPPAPDGRCDPVKDKEDDRMEVDEEAEVEAEAEEQEEEKSEAEGVVSPATSEDFEKAVGEPCESAIGAADEGQRAAADEGSPAATADAEDVASPATSDGFEKVDTVSSVADDEAPDPAAEVDGTQSHGETPESASPEDAAEGSSQPRSESYEEVLEVDAKTVGHDLDDISDYELL